MYQRINFSDFCDSFIGDRKNQFSYEGKKAIFDYLEEYEESTGEEIELDPIEICCDWTEYDSFEDVQKEYEKIKTIEELEDSTQVIPIPDSDALIIQNF